MGTRTLAWSNDRKCLAPIDIDEARDHLDNNLTVWVDVRSTDPHEFGRLHHQFGIDTAVLTDAAGPVQLPKLQTFADSIFVILHGIYMEDDKLKTAQVNCVVTENLFLTMAQRHVPGLDWLWKEIPQPQVRRSSSPDELLGHLAEVIGHRYLAVINEFDDQIDDVYEEALTARRRVLTKVQRLRRQAASISKVSRPQRVVLNDLQSLDHPVIGDGRPLLRDAFDVQNMVVESLASTRSLLADTLDTYRGATGDRQSTASTVLAVYSAVMLPLTFIGGFYGMNVALPGMNYKPAWIVLAIVMLAIAIGSIAIFLKVGFIRLPQRPTTKRRGQTTSIDHGAAVHAHHAARDAIDAAAEEPTAKIEATEATGDEATGDAPSD